MQTQLCTTADSNIAELTYWTYSSPLNMLTAFWAITWRHPATTNPVSSKVLIVLDVTFAALKRLVPQIPVTYMYTYTYILEILFWWWSYVVWMISYILQVPIYFRILFNKHAFIIWAPHSSKCQIDVSFKIYTVQFQCSAWLSLY